MMVHLEDHLVNSLALTNVTPYSLPVYALSFELSGMPSNVMLEIND